MGKVVLMLGITVLIMACVIMYLVADRLCDVFFKNRETKETLRRVNGLLCAISQKLGICNLKDSEKTPQSCHLIPMLPKELQRCEKLTIREETESKKEQPK